MSRKTEYNNRYNKEHYDRINMFMPKGYKEQIKSKADELEIGLSEYIFTLICNDLSGVSANISDQKQGLDDDGLALLKKWQVAKRYIEMIENVSYTTGNYYIQLKAGYINDVTGSREIHAKNSSEIRVVVTKSHKLGLKAKGKIIENPAADWLSDEDIDRLKHWQVPKKYYAMLHSVTCLNGLYSINLQEGYINDSTGTNKVEFKNVAELRAIMKLTHEQK